MGKIHDALQKAEQMRRGASVPPESESAPIDTAAPARAQPQSKAKRDLALALQARSPRIALARRSGLHRRSDALRGVPDPARAHPVAAQDARAAQHRDHVEPTERGQDDHVRQSRALLRARARGRYLPGRRRSAYAARARDVRLHRPGGPRGGAGGRREARRGAGRGARYAAHGPAGARRCRRRPRSCSRRARWPTWWRSSTRASTP